MKLNRNKPNHIYEILYARLKHILGREPTLFMIPEKPEYEQEISKGKEAHYKEFLSKAAVDDLSGETFFNENASVEEKYLDKARYDLAGMRRTWINIIRLRGADVMLLESYIEEEKVFQSYIENLIKEEEHR